MKKLENAELLSAGLRDFGMESRPFSDTVPLPIFTGYRLRAMKKLRKYVHSRLLTLYLQLPRLKTVNLLLPRRTKRI